MTTVIHIDLLAKYAYGKITVRYEMDVEDPSKSVILSDLPLKRVIARDRNQKQIGSSISREFKGFLVKFLDVLGYLEVSFFGIVIRRS